MGNWFRIWPLYALSIPPLVLLTLGKTLIWRAVWKATWRWCIVTAAVTNCLWTFLTLSVPLTLIGILFTGGLVTRFLPSAWGRQLDAALGTSNILQILSGIAIVCLLIAIIECLILIGLRKAPVGRSLAAAAIANCALCLTMIALAIVLISPVIGSALRGAWPKAPPGRPPLRP